MWLHSQYGHQWVHAGGVHADPSRIYMYLYVCSFLCIYIFTEHQGENLPSHLHQRISERRRLLPPLNALPAAAQRVWEVFARAEQIPI